MRQFNFNHLHYFHCVASEGSLAQAARRLYISQSTISAQIKELESFLGRRLFNRPPGGGLVLTDAGRRVLEHTTTMFRVSGQLLASFHPELSTPNKVLEVGMVSAASRVFAAHFFLPLFRMGGILPRIHSGNHDELYAALVAHELDLLLSDVRPRDGGADGIEARIIHRVDLVAIGTPSLGKAVKIFPADLGLVPCIGYVASSPTRLDVAQWFHENNLHPPVAAETDDVNMMLEAARAGLCFAVVPRSVASRSVEDGSVVELGTVARGAELSGLYRADETASLANDLIASLIEEFRKA